MSCNWRSFFGSAGITLGGGPLPKVPFDPPTIVTPKEAAEMKTPKEATVSAKSVLWGMIAAKRSKALQTLEPLPNPYKIVRTFTSKDGVMGAGFAVRKGTRYVASTHPDDAYRGYMMYGEGAGVDAYKALLEEDPICTQWTTLNPHSLFLAYRDAEEWLQQFLGEKDETFYNEQGYRQ